VCVCVRSCLVCLCGQPVSFGISWGLVHGTWEQNHNDQQTYGKCTGLSTVVKQIIFEDSLTFTGVDSCMFCEINAVFVKYTRRGNAA
jgi:hypothetical protein